MRLLTRGRSGPKRKGVILLVVLSMLTLFALVGVSFVLVADAQATSGRIALQSESAFRPDIDPEAAFALFLGQLIYDAPDDAAGIFSALRGGSLARNMYGWNPTPGVLNDKPYNGTGRLHGATQAGWTGIASDEAALMNYMFFSADGFIRDPERPGLRSTAAPFNVNNPSAGQNAYTGGFGVPYTYPDHNNFYLAEIDPGTGQVIVPSFHRPYLFGPLDLPSTGTIPYPTAGANFNPNWTNAQGKYLTLRPTPAYHPAFPMPLDGGGDVKNLDFAPGGADSIWIDIGAPVMTAADGRKYKMLVAPLILALDGRIDLNAVGNVMGAGDHRSNQGWGVWEVNPKKILDQGTEWTNLFNGSSPAPTLARIRGRYDLGTARGPSGAQIRGNSSPRDWAQVDYDGMKSDGTTAEAYQIPKPGSNRAYLGFPLFPNPRDTSGLTYLNGGAENNNHASIYNVLRPRNANRRFPTESVAQMLRGGGTGGDMLVSDPMRLLSQNLGTATGANVRRNLLTLLSADLDRPGATPYIYDTSVPAGRFLAGIAPDLSYRPANKPPYAQFPTVPPIGPLVPGGEFDASWRSDLAKLLRLDLNRPLTKYTGAGANVSQAIADRQQFASDIFNVLVKVTGAIPPQITPVPYPAGASEYQGVRYLAQLAANIVDQIDNDDVMTAFQWASFDVTGAATPQYVFGVELPRLVINETYTQFDNDAGSLLAPLNTSVDPTKKYDVNVWAELHNPMPAPLGAGAAADDTTATLSNPNGLVYRLLLVNADLNDTGAKPFRDPGNATGDPDFGLTARATNILGAMTAWGVATDPQTVSPGGGVFNDTTKKNLGFYVVGPVTNLLDDTKDKPTLPVTISSPAMSYKVAADDTKPIPRPTVVLQRLANPNLAWQNVPTQPNYNPWITVDFSENGTAAAPMTQDGRRFNVTGDNTTAVTYKPMAMRQAFGRNQPYAALLTQKIAQQPKTAPPVIPAPGQPQNTFFQQNCAAADATTAGTGLNNLPAGGDATLKIPFDWLTHLDRYPSNPMELLHVSDARPHDLTQRFITGTAAAPLTHQHVAPWTDKDARLYRFFEFVTSGVRGTGAVHPTDPVTDPATDPVAGVGGRVAGRVNINMIRHLAVFQALADAQSGNSFTEAGHVNPMWTAFSNRRSTPAGGVGPTDQTLAALSGQTQHFPLWSLALGQADATTDQFLRQPATRGIENTMLQGVFDVPDPVAPNPPLHPYQKKELLRKIYGSVTTRSNVFAVWATVGYFECDPSVSPPRLGAEMGAAENRQIRHRMFSIIDRTQLQMWPTASRTVSNASTVQSSVAITIPTTTPPSTSVSAAVSLQKDDGTPLPFGGPASVTRADSATGVGWTLQQNAILVYEPNTDNEETVVVDSTGKATFSRNHNAGVPVVVRGNPGPLQRYDPRQDKDVVPYFGLID